LCFKLKRKSSFFSSNDEFKLEKRARNREREREREREKKRRERDD